MIHAAMPPEDVQRTWAYRRRKLLGLAFPMLLLFAVAVAPGPRVWVQANSGWWALAFFAYGTVAGIWSYVQGYGRCPNCEEGISVTRNPSFCPRCGVALRGAPDDH